MSLGLVVLEKKLFTRTPTPQSDNIKIRQSSCLIIVIAPRLARDALVLGPSAALNRDPTSTSSVKISSQTVTQLEIGRPVDSRCE